MSALELLAEAGFTDEGLSIALGVAYAESAGYADAVGDIEIARLGPYPDQQTAQADWDARRAAGKPAPVPSESVVRLEGDEWYVVNTKWGPSIGLFQIRALDDPNSWGLEDRVRIAEKLRDPKYNAQAAFVISEGGTDWLKWSVYRSGAYLPYAGEDFEIRTGHPRAGEWSK